MSIFLPNTPSLEVAIAQVVAAAAKSGTAIERVVEQLRMAAAGECKFRPGDEFRPVASKTALSGVIGSVDYARRCYVCPRLGGSPLLIPFDRQHEFARVERCALVAGDRVWRKADAHQPTPPIYAVRYVYTHGDYRTSDGNHETFSLALDAARSGTSGSPPPEANLSVPFAHQDQWELATLRDGK